MSERDEYDKDTKLYKKDEKGCSYKRRTNFI